MHISVDTVMAIIQGARTSELHEISEKLCKVIEDRKALLATKPTPEEIVTHEVAKIKAIMMLRDRLECDLSIAKEIVDGWSFTEQEYIDASKSISPGWRV